MKATRTCGLALALAAALALLTWSPALHADAKAADAAFRKGKTLLQKKQYQEACAAFEQSFQEDPAIGAQLNTARCYQEWGKTATAYRAYEEALRLAREAKDDRASQIEDLMKDLERDVPVVVISLPPGRLPPDGLKVTVDGAELPRAQLGKPQRLDPGEHEVVMSSASGEPQTLSVTVSAKKRAELELPIDLAASPEDTATEAVSSSSPGPAPGRTRRIAGLVAGGVGVLGLGVATYLALDARSDYNSAFDAHCMADTKQCDEEGLTLTADARSQANAGTVVGGLALAAIAAGAVLYFTAPSAGAESTQTARTIRPLVWRDGVGVVFGGAL